ncbi:hypothetical protein X975_14281, partial [Stegodyphus mimosarum]
MNGKSSEIIEGYFNELVLELKDWREKEGLKFNIQKANAVFFPRAGKQIREPRLKYKKQRIKFGKEIKCFGVIVDDKLNFISHFNMVHKN